LLPILPAPYAVSGRFRSELVRFRNTIPTYLLGFG
jgi:hypothetical protein